MYLTNYRSTLHSSRPPQLHTGALPDHLLNQIDRSITPLEQTTPWILVCLHPTLFSPARTLARLHPKIWCCSARAWAKNVLIATRSIAIRNTLLESLGTYYKHDTNLHGKNRYTVYIGMYTCANVLWNLMVYLLATLPFCTVDIRVTWRTWWATVAGIAEEFGILARAAFLPASGTIGLAVYPQYQRNLGNGCHNHQSNL